MYPYILLPRDYVCMIDEKDCQGEYVTKYVIGRCMKSKAMPQTVPNTIRGTPNV